MEIFPLSLTDNSVFIGPNKLKFGTETRCIVLCTIPNLGQIDQKFHSFDFRDVICKPPIGPAMILS